MEHIGFQHAPVTDGEVEHIRQSLWRKRFNASALLGSAFVVLLVELLGPWAYNDVSVADVPMVARLWYLAGFAYFGIAGFFSTMWLINSFTTDDPERFEPLSLTEMKDLQALCDGCPRAREIVASWLSSGAILRRRDFRVIQRLVGSMAAAEKNNQDAAERARIIESLRAGQPPAAGAVGTPTAH